MAVDREIKKDAKISMDKKVYQEGYVYAVVNGKKEMFPIEMVKFKDGKSLGQHLKDMALEIGMLRKDVKDAVDELKKTKDELKEYQGV